VMLNPFLYRRHDLQLFLTYYRVAIERANGTNGPSRAEIEHELDTWLARSGDASTRAWMAYSRGDFDRALGHYADAMKRRNESAGYRTERGRIFGMRGQADSAIAEFRLALGELRKQDAKDVVYLYNSKAVLEQGIAVMLEQMDSVSAAREAYGRALQEDLSYWPGHVRLGMLAIAAHDTTTAVSELTLASQIAPDEPYVHGMVGASLALLGKAEDALAELKKAAALEDYYALPHVVIARIYDRAGFAEEATASYRAFLARASRSDAQRPLAEQRLAALAAAGGDR
jgi:tetratricopeptide (TPR) repeat protein